MNSSKTLSTAAVIFSGLLLISACGKSSPESNISPTRPAVSPSASASPENSEQPSVGERSEGSLTEVDTIGGLIRVTGAEEVALPEIPNDVYQYYTLEEVKSGAEYAVSFSYATAYDQYLWHKIISAGPNSDVDIIRSDLSLWVKRFTVAGREKLYDLAGGGKKSLENFFVLPSPQEGDNFGLDPFRPIPQLSSSADYDKIPYESYQYKINSIGLGPNSEYDNKPTLKISLEDYAFYDWKNNGEWVAVYVKRTPTYYLSSTNSTDGTWLVDNWETPPGESKPTTPFAREAQ